MNGISKRHAMVSASVTNATEQPHTKLKWKKVGNETRE